jgi:hypothetical protein
MLNSLVYQLTAIVAKMFLYRITVTVAINEKGKDMSTFLWAVLSTLLWTCCPHCYGLCCPQIIRNITEHRGSAFMST